MTALERTVIEFLVRHRDGTSASIVGAHVWGHTRKGHVVASQGGGDYAAQMLLGRMRKRGWVRVLDGEGSSMWAATRKGLVDWSESIAEIAIPYPEGAQAAATVEVPRLTPAQRTLLTKLDRGQPIVDDDYKSHVTPGRPSRVERTLMLLADRGLIDWSEGVAEVAITELGRKAL